MILLEVVDAERRNEPQKTSNDRHTRRSDAPPRPSTSSSTGLPDYATSQAQATGKRTSIDSIKYEKAPQPKSSPTPGDRKVRRIIVYALAAYFVISLAIGLPLFFVLRERQHNEDSQYSHVRASNNMGGLPPPAPMAGSPLDIFLIPPINESIVGCSSWSSNTQGPPFSLAYSFPANESIYVLSNITDVVQADAIPPPLGNLHVFVSQNTSQKNALITVSASDISDQTLQKSSFCLIRSDCGWGLGIYVPNDTNIESAYFDVQLSLPQPSRKSQIDQLITNLPRFNQSFDSLDVYGSLPSFIVQGSVGSINAESVHANVILIKAAASEIGGTFNSSNTLILETMRASIFANVSLHNDAQSMQPPTTMQVTTGSGDVSLNISLHSDSMDPNEFPPAFRNMIKSVSGNVQAAFRHDPSLQESILMVNAMTSSKPAQVFVDDVYQGTFDINPMLGKAYFTQDSEPVDPTGHNRNRTVDQYYWSTNRLYGWSGWGQRIYDAPNPNQYPQGHISVMTSMSDATLQLTDVPNLQSTFSPTSAIKGMCGPP